MPVCAADRIDEKQVGPPADHSADRFIDFEAIQAHQNATAEMEGAAGSSIERLRGLGIQCETSRLPILIDVLHIVQ